MCYLGSPERDQNRPYGYVDGIVQDRQTWKAKRDQDIRYEDREPQASSDAYHGG